MQQHPYSDTPFHSEGVGSRNLSNRQDLSAGALRETWGALALLLTAKALIFLRIFSHLFTDSSFFLRANMV